MNTRKRKIVLQNTDDSTRNLAQKMVDKGYEVMLKFEESEETVPFPL